MPRPAVSRDWEHPRPAESHDGHDARPATPMNHSDDHRFARPEPHHVPACDSAHHSPPHDDWYRPWYSHWYVHPYYRWMHSTVVFVDLPFVAYAWDTGWAPPPRYGWLWVSGYWVGGMWFPGYWAPIAPAPIWVGATYVYEPGWWMGPTYVEGYWRVADRHGWVWVPGQYVGDDYVWGHWEPVAPARAGYVWEAGFWDGEVYVEGFWREEYRAGYRWVSSAYDRGGIYHAGYWEPIDDQPGYVWIPGWFDGLKWVPGYWVRQADVDAADPEHWQPEPGWNEGWDSPQRPSEDAGPPLALPVE